MQVRCFTQEVFAPCKPCLSGVFVCVLFSSFTFTNIVMKLNMQMLVSDSVKFKEKFTQKLTFSEHLLYTRLG